jgi:Leucine-rich repeat (LRR) protein
MYLKIDDIVAEQMPKRAIIRTDGQWYAYTESRYLDDVTELNVNNSSITSLDIIRFLPNLVILNCAGNQLTKLPHLPFKLEFLNCSDNKLTGLTNYPIGIRQLAKSMGIVLYGALNYLYCADNQITELPDELRALEELNCSNNRLAKLPNTLTKLQWLSCGGNPDLVVPDYLLGNCEILQ